MSGVDFWFHKIGGFGESPPWETTKYHQVPRSPGYHPRSPDKTRTESYWSDRGGGEWVLGGYEKPSACVNLGEIFYLYTKKWRNNRRII